MNYNYSVTEERINIFSHAIGILFSIFSLILLNLKAFELQSTIHFFCYNIFGITMFFLYFASTLYHSTKEKKTREKRRVFDHLAIYLLIAGSYTPFLLIALQGTIGLIVTILVWSFAAIGVILKIFFTGRFKLFSTIMYVVLGWFIVLFIKPLSANLDSSGLYLLFGGGIFYTIGAILYNIKKLPLNHAIFHIFVLLGTLSHFLAIYFFV